MTSAKVPWTGRDLLIAVGWMLLVGVLPAALVIVIAIALAHAGHSFRSLPVYRVGLGLLALTLLVYGGAFFGVYRRTIRKYGLAWSALFSNPPKLGQLAAIVALFVPIELCIAFVTAMQNVLTGHVEKNPQQAIVTAIPHHPVNYVALFICFTILAPIVEEIVFRGFFYRWLRKSLGVRSAIVISAGVFAVAHGLPKLIPPLFFLGVVLAYLFERTRSLYCSIFFHFLQNAVALTTILVVSK